MKLKEEYENWMETGELPENGLCKCLRDTKYKSTLDLFKPSTYEFEELSKNNFDIVFWGSGLYYNSNGCYKEFTPLRQTIILLILAIHEE